MNVLHLTTHLNIGGITSYIRLITGAMQGNSYRFYVGSGGGTQVPRLEEQNVSCFHLSIRTKSELSPKIYRAIGPLIRFVRQNHIDLIHAHTRVTQVLAWWVRFFTGTPYVSTCHGFYKRRLGRRLMPAWGNHVIAISNPVAESLTRDFKVRHDRISTIFNAIDIEDLNARFRLKNAAEIRRNLNIPAGCPVVGIIARVVEDKGHEYFLRAACHLISTSIPNLVIMVVGEGPYLSTTKMLTKKLGLENAVYFTGNLQDVTEALAVIDLFVLPAIWREGFGLSIIEAMAVCKPVVVTNIWALNELIQDRVNGLLVEPRNVDHLARAICELFHDQKLYRTVAENGCEMVKQNFSVSHMGRRMGELYERVISASR